MMMSMFCYVNVNVQQRAFIHNLSQCSVLFSPKMSSLPVLIDKKILCVVCIDRDGAVWSQGGLLAQSLNILPCTNKLSHRFVCPFVGAQLVAAERILHRVQNRSAYKCEYLFIFTSAPFKKQNLELQYDCA